MYAFRCHAAQNPFLPIYLQPMRRAVLTLKSMSARFGAQPCNSMDHGLDGYAGKGICKDPWPLQ
jgi:hypothetical protein